ncbi:MAG TPA: hypothetical protein VKB79_23305 [Bryobacteraceae bacterium]|nr:hypothetical protein [Bryobacteraceae bacterium]
MEPNDELLDESIENVEEISPEDAEKVTGGGITYGADLTYGN